MKTALAAFVLSLILLSGCNSNKTTADSGLPGGKCRTPTRCFQGDKCKRENGHDGPHKCDFAGHAAW